MKKPIFRRLRRAKKTRYKLKVLDDRHRLTIHISNCHIYAQVFSPDGSQVLASASTLDKEVKASLDKQAANKKTAGVVGKFIAERAKAAGITAVGFDRSGFQYHGRVEALAEAARANGLDF